MQVETCEEEKTVAWMEHKTTEASSWLEVISLKESILWKAWAGWEEGLRLARRQQKIGEATTRMETMSDQLIPVLKLSEGEHEWLETWKRQYLGQPDGIKEDWMDGGVIGSDA